MRRATWGIDRYAGKESLMVQLLKQSVASRIFILYFNFFRVMERRLLFLLRGKNS
jgi:hypothetical protein